MANEITSSVGSELYTNILQEAIFTAQEKSIMLPLVTVYDISGQAGKTVQVPIYPTVSASAVAEGSDLANTAINPSEVTITASEQGVMASISDLMRESAGRNVAQDVGRILGEAVAKKADEDITGLFTGLSTSVGSAGTELTADLIFKAVAELRVDNAPAPFYGVFHPKAIYNLKKTLANAGSVSALSDIGNEALRTGYVGQIAGVQLFESAVIGIDSADDSIGAVFSPKAFGVASKKGLTIEEDRNASARLTEYVATATWGVAELVDAYGVKVVSDSAL
jgi:N4-gp56 family major capsid protein